jgi:capsule polysaccharide export protein KpsE/RkpR
MKKHIEKILITDDFTLVNLVKLGKAKLKILVGTILAFILFGFIYYSTTPESYSAQSILLVESQNSNAAGGLGSLAQVAGFSMPGSTRELATLDPALYPFIVQSKPFLEDLMNSKVKSELYSDSVSLFKYMVETRPENSISKFIKSPLSVFKSGVTVNDKERETNAIKERTKYEPLEIYAINQIGGRITANSEGSLLYLITNMPEADLAFQFSKMVKSLLIEYATKYLQEKQKSHVDYLEVQYTKSEEGFKDAQNALTSFKERNQGLFLESMKAIEQNLNAEYNLKFELYRTIAKELETSKIELNNQKPIFSEMEPAFIPNRPTAPNLILTLAFSLTLGFVFGIILIFLIYIKAYLKLHQGSTE